MKNDIVIVGAGGHCRVALAILNYHEEFEVIGIADRGPENLGEEIAGSVIKYTWNDFDEIYRRGTRHAVIAVGDNREREVLFSTLKNVGFNIPTIIHPTAFVEKDVRLKDGNVICAGANIGAMASLGENCVLYTGSILDHEVEMGDNVFIAPGCRIAGRVKIKNGSFIGIGSTIVEKIIIGPNATTGAGSVVIRDVPENDVVAGVPARSINPNVA